MTDKGYIKLHRSILDWEWYQDTNTKVVFLHLLLNAQWEDSRYHGYVVPKGSLVIGRKKLAEELEITERAVRTALNHLKSTNEVTIKVTNQFSIVTIVNWAKYQGRDDESDQQNDQQNDQRVTNERPATDHIKEYKEYKNIRNEEVYTRIWDAYNSVCVNLCRCHSLTKPRIDKLNELLDVFTADEIIDVFKKANGMPYLTSGKNKIGWKADFDWLIDIENFVKVQDGRYDEMQKATGSYQEYKHSGYDFDALEKEIRGRRNG